MPLHRPSVSFQAGEGNFLIIRALKSAVRANPSVYRLARRVRRSFEPPSEIDRLRTYLLGLTRRIPHPVFVKVGANDGITGDPCGNIFLEHSNWTGLLIEPVPYCVKRLQTIYSDRSRFAIDQVAVGSSSEAATFYYVSERAKKSLPDLPEWYDQLGSFDRQHISKHLEGA